MGGPETGEEMTEPTIDLNALKAEMIAAEENCAAIEEEFENRYALVRSAIAKLDADFGAANAELIKARDEERARAESLEKTLRSAIVAAYDRNPEGGKHLGDGLSVQVRSKYEYREDEALTWAKTNAAVLIVESVDRKGFEAMLKGMKKLPPFVRISESTVAVIKK